jgi:hypothetical protein
MDTRIQIWAVLASGALLLVVLELVRRRRFLERYALVWIGCCVVLLVLSVWSGALTRLADLFGIKYAPNALFFIAFAFVLFLLLHFSIAVSRLADHSKLLAQRLALLEERLRRQEHKTAEEEDETVSLPH